VAAVGNVLVAGAGLAGTAAAIHLAAAGVAVALIAVSETAAALGSGITLQGNALRELRKLGVWDQVQAQGYSFSSVGFRAPDPAGTLLAEVPDARSGGADLPATCGMPRPALARILLERAAEAGAAIRLGTSYTALHQVAIPHIGLLIGEMWDLDALAAHCAADGVHEFWLTAAPLPVTGAVGSPVNPIAVK